MIDISFADTGTGLDTLWTVSIKEHTPLDEVRNVAYAEAGDYIAPDTIYKGSYQVTRITSNPIPVIEKPIFDRLVESSKKGGEITIDASSVPLVAAIYHAIRTGNLRAVTTSSGRHFSFVLNLRILRVEP